MPDDILTGPAEPEDRAVLRSRSADVAVCLLLLGLALLMGWDNWKTGISWAADGPEVGYFPFYLSVLLGAASLVGLARAILEHRVGHEPFVTRSQLRRVLQVLIPTVLYVAAIQVLGLYVASFILIAGFMMAIGRLPPVASLLTGLVFSALMFATFEIAFNVIMPKGPLEAAFGY